MLQPLKRAWEADRAACVIAAALVVLGWLPLVWPTHLMMQDMTAHMEVLSAWRRLLAGEPLTHYALVPGLPPYLLTYLVCLPLSWLVGEDWALRLVCMVYVAAMPASAAYMLRAYDRDPRLALYAIALTYNTIFLYGFIPNAAAYPVLFVLLGSFRHALLVPSIQREAANAALLTALYMTHLSGALAFAVAGPLILLAHVRGDVSQLLRRGAFVAPAVALALWWQYGRMGGGLEVVAQSWSGALGTASAWLVRASFTRWEFLYQSILVATFFVLCALAYYQRNQPAEGPAGWSLGLAGAGLFGMFLMMPFEIHAPILQVAANARLLVPAALCFVALPRVRLDGRARWALAPLVVAVAAWTGALGMQAARIDAQARQITPVLAALPPDARVLSVSWDTLHVGAFCEPLKHLPRLHMLRGDGVVAGGFADDRQHGVMPVRYTRAWPAPPGSEGRQLTWADHACWYDYVVLISEAPVLPSDIPGGADTLELVRRDGVFTLLRVRRGAAFCRQTQQSVGL
jgi:hypothetical protein